jgi:predicted enzyme related to lactoylglutathione lyase
MAHDFQVGVDCARPHELADWWAGALGWEVVRPDPAFIRRMITEGHATEDDAITHDGELVWKSAAAIHQPGDGGGRIYFQQVPEPKTVKNRLHLDVRVGAGNVAAEAARLAERGATLLYRGQQGPNSWITMADPEGNEFCLM